MACSVLKLTFPKIAVARAREKGINLQLSEFITTTSEQDAGRRARWLRFRAGVGMARVGALGIIRRVSRTSL